MMVVPGILYVRLCLLSPLFPQILHVSLKHKNFQEWRKAMDDEFMALMQQGTWSLVPYKAGMNLVCNKWVYKTKMRSDGTIERRKARLVAKGYHQQYGLDYTDTFSSVIKPTIIRLVLTHVVSHNWPIHQIDISNAF